MFTLEILLFTRLITLPCSGILIQNIDPLFIASDHGLQVLKIIFFWIGFFYIITSITNQSNINVICISIHTH